MPAASGRMPKPSSGSGCEQLSARMALEALGDHPAAQEVARLILLTKSHQPGDGPDDAWIIDIDLAIFAQPMKRVLEYERQIRLEYAWVPEEVYVEKRAEILTAFFEAPADLPHGMGMRAV